MKPVPESVAMKSLRPFAPFLFSLWAASCATAKNTTLPDGSAGESTSPAGAAGTTAPNPGAGGKIGGGAGATSSGGSSASGRGGAAGGGGAGGSAGSAGSSGGAAAVFEPGACADAPTLSLKYQNESTQAAQIAAEYQVSNTSDTPVALGSLIIRYFFSSEETSGWTPSVFNAEVKGPGDAYQKAEGTLKVVPLGSKVEGADTYAELTFAAGPMLAKGATAAVKWALQPSNYSEPNQVQSNDYSYNAADTAFTVWDHVAIYQDGTLVWGCLPKAADGSAGGSSGGGAGGASGTGGGGASGASGTGGGGARGAGGSVAGGGGVATGGTAGSVAGSAGATSAAGGP